MPSDTPHDTAHTFIRGPLAAIFAKTAPPIIFVMSLNDLLAVVDGIIPGVYVGPEVLGAMTASGTI